MKDCLELLSQLLGEQKLYIADVGSSGGPEERWKSFLDLCYFYTFDPDPRAAKWDTPSNHFPLGLWSKPERKMLCLKQYPPASSFFEYDDKELKSFGFLEFFKTVGKQEIAVDCLDNILQQHPLDFLKIDAEGAELEILKGAEKVLDRGVLGLQIEVFFMPARHRAPSFGEIESFLQQKGFFVYKLQREHWLRKNRLYSHKSSPQLIWANALFLPSKSKFLAILESKREKEREIFLAKFIMILLGYKIYDFAYELAEENGKEDLCQLISEMLKTSPFLPIKLVISLLVGLGKYCITFSNQKKARRVSYLKRKMREFGSFCLSLGKHDYALYDE